MNKGLLHGLETFDVEYIDRPGENNYILATSNKPYPTDKHGKLVVILKCEEQQSRSCI